MSVTVSARVGRVLGAARPLNEAVAMLRLLARLGSDLVNSVRGRRFPFEELLVQTWYTIRVCTLPALMVSIPFGVILALQVGVLAQQVGAVSFTGAGNTLAVVRQASPIITALMLSGVAGSAICADIGARKIREELDALGVMGISVTERLILPRALCTVIVAVLLNGVVMFFTIMLVPELRATLAENRGTLTSLLGKGRTVSEIGADRQPALMTWLDYVPLQARAMIAGTRDGAGRVVLIPNPSKLCKYDGTKQRLPSETTKRPPARESRCTVEDPLVQQRGAQYVPRP